MQHCGTTACISPIKYFIFKCIKSNLFSQHIFIHLTDREQYNSSGHIPWFRQSHLERSCRLLWLLPACRWWHRHSQRNCIAACVPSIDINKHDCRISFSSNCIKIMQEYPGYKHCHLASVTSFWARFCAVVSGWWSLGVKFPPTIPANQSCFFTYFLIASKNLFKTNFWKNEHFELQEYLKNLVAFHVVYPIW